MKVEYMNMVVAALSLLPILYCVLAPTLLLAEIHRHGYAPDSTRVM